MRLPIAIVAAGSLILGFLVALIFGFRAIGGVVLVVGGLWCAWQLVKFAGWWRMLVVAVVYTAAFVLSHPLGDVIGAWPSVIVVAFITGLVAYFIVPRTA